MVICWKSCTALQAFGGAAGNCRFGTAAANVETPATSVVTRTVIIYIHMALRVSAARKLACANCRQYALRSFIASIGGHPTQQTPKSRAFSARSGTTSNEARERLQSAVKDEEHALNDINDSIESAKAEVKIETHEVESHSGMNSQVQNPAHVPWYLQLEQDLPTPENAVSARQRIPDLPDHPPPILQPLLERVSVELGMDDLSILDLRSIDPPPALGANLLMIIGTARSEKHLHFSADKLCRWLRSEHHLTPYADGLLGRQELKLKMRRRAKRARLMSAVGAKSTADTELDEGIRTGWICVNLGKVEGGELPKSEEDMERERNVVGFGTQTSGSRIVVQLLTEDKRGEIDLERLWNGVLKKSKRENEALLAMDTERAVDVSIDMEGAGTRPETSPEQSESSKSAYHPMMNERHAQKQARA